MYLRESSGLVVVFATGKTKQNLELKIRAHSREIDTQTASYQGEGWKNMSLICFGYDCWEQRHLDGVYSVLFT